MAAWGLKPEGSILRLVEPCSITSPMMLTFTWGNKERRLSLWMLDGLKHKLNKLYEHSMAASSIGSPEKGGEGI